MRFIKFYLGVIFIIPILFILFILRDPLYTYLKTPVIVSLIILIFTFTFSVIIYRIIYLKYKIDLIHLDKRGLEAEIKAKELKVVVRIENIPNNPLLIRPNGDVYQLGKLPNWRINGILEPPTMLEIQTNLVHLGYKPKKDPLIVDNIYTLPSKVFLEDYVNNHSIHNLFLGIGEFDTGEIRPVYKSIKHLMHVGVSGVSGFGKSTFQDILVYQILNSQEETGVILLDSGLVSFTKYENHPKLLYPITSNEREILEIVEDVSREVNRRLELMSNCQGVTHIDDYNKLTGENIPYLFLAFDEFANVLEGNSELQNRLKYLVRLARKVGCYCCFSSQTWKSHEISTSLREQLVTRVQFYCHSKRESTVFLDDSIGSQIKNVGESYARFRSEIGFIHLQTPISRQNILELPEIIPEEDNNLSPEDEKFLDLVSSGYSMSKACQEVYNKTLAGSMYNHCKNLVERLTEA